MTNHEAWFGISIMLRGTRSKIGHVQKFDTHGLSTIPKKGNSRISVRYLDRSSTRTEVKHRRILGVQLQCVEIQCGNHTTYYNDIDSHLIRAISPRNTHGSKSSTKAPTGLLI